jgi:hypothetical protein
MPMNNLVYIFLLYCISCSSGGGLTIEEMKSFSDNEKNNLITKQTFDQMEFTIRYEPVELIALRGASSADEFKKSYPEILQNYSELEYYTLTIKSLTKSTRDKVSELFTGMPEETDSYFDFEIQNDIQMVQNGDSIPCAYLHKEVSESITNMLTYSIAFGKQGIRADRNIVLISRLKDIPNIQFIITQESIESIPALKINSL